MDTKNDEDDSVSEGEIVPQAPSSDNNPDVEDAKSNSRSSTPVQSSIPTFTAASTSIPEWSPPPSWLGSDKMSGKYGILKSSASTSSLAGHTNFFSVPIGNVTSNTAVAVHNFIRSGGKYLLEQHVKRNRGKKKKAKTQELQKKDNARLRLKQAYDDLQAQKDQHEQYKRKANMALEKLDDAKAAKERLTQQILEELELKKKEKREEIKKELLEEFRQKRNAEWEKKEAELRAKFLEEWNAKQEEETKKRKERELEEEKEKEAQEKEEAQPKKKLKSDVLKEKLEAEKANREYLQETRSELVWLLKQVIQAETKQKMQMAMQAKKAGGK